jgi:hypothetical protein
MTILRERLTQKELDLAQLRKEVEALRTVAPLLMEEPDRVWDMAESVTTV